MREKKSCIYYVRRRKNFLYCEAARFSFDDVSCRDRWYRKKCAKGGAGCPMKITLDAVIKKGSDDLYGVNLSGE